MNKEKSLTELALEMRAACIDTKNALKGYKKQDTFKMMAEFCKPLNYKL